MQGRVGSWVCRIVWHTRFRISGYDGVNQNKDETTRLEHKACAQNLGVVLARRNGLDLLFKNDRPVNSFIGRMGGTLGVEMESFPTSVFVVTRRRIGTHFLGTAGISVDMADG